jgi:hypothetical protein
VKRNPKPRRKKQPNTAFWAEARRIPGAGLKFATLLFLASQGWAEPCPPKRGGGAVPALLWVRRVALKLSAAGFKE